MKKTTSIATASLNQTPLDWKGNYQRTVDALEVAKKKGAKLVCFPELSISGYGCEDQFFSEGTRNKALDYLLKLAEHSKDCAFLVGLPVSLNNKIYNCAAMLAGGQVCGIVAKQNLANYGLHYETRWFSQWQAKTVTTIEFDGLKIPFGDIVFSFSGIRAGVEICHDAWVDFRPCKINQELGLDIVLNPSASHFAFGKYKFVRELLLDTSKSEKLVYAYANLLGNEAGRVIYDGKGLIAQKGKILSEHKRFSFREFTVESSCASFKVKSTADNKSEQVVELDFSIEKECTSSGSKEVFLSKEEEFTRAVSIGLFDYLRKSKAKGYIISLSGGADSSAGSVLVRYMVALGVSELGLKEFQKRLLGSVNFKSEEELVGNLLTLVYQATSSSSDTTENSARELAEGLGGEFIKLDVDSLVEGYKEIVSQAIGRELSWESDDLALQNIQARTRAPSVWLLANIKNALLLATSNRSEAAVGYTTMDGDTCGGLSPIGGIDKAYLKSWLLWAENTGPEDLFPISSLKRVNQLEPSAELRPGGQKDEEDLMPYEVLDLIERLAIRDKLLPISVFEKLKTSNLEFSEDELKAWTRKFFKLWSQNQWKRERYAPSFHLDDENLDPKTWCRFPILSAGFEEELRELDAL